MTFHPKLVRDKIPQIITASGKSCKYRQLSDAEYESALYEKLREELSEFEETPSVEEAADMYEVLLAMMHHWGLSASAVTEAAYEKRMTRGGFGEKIFLENIEK